jgi:hypothetical protein
MFNFQQKSNLLAATLKNIRCLPYSLEMIDKPRLVFPRVLVCDKVGDEPRLILLRGRVCGKVCTEVQLPILGGIYGCRMRW